MRDEALKPYSVKATQTGINFILAVSSFEHKIEAIKILKIWKCPLPPKPRPGAKRRNILHLDAAFGACSSASSGHCVGMAL